MKRLLLITATLVFGMAICHEAEGGPLFGPVTSVSELNTSLGDFPTSISADGLTIYTESFIPSNNRQQQFSATRPDLNSPFGTPSDALFINTNNTPGTFNTGGGVVSSSGLEMFYSASNQIFRATRSDTSSAFEAGTLATDINGGDGRTNWLSPDNLRLYTMSAGVMYVSERSSNTSAFGAASSASFATSGGGLEATLTPDELQIYFSAGSGTTGLGDVDIWWASRTDRFSAFGLRENVTSINTAFRDRSPVLFGDTLFFSSSRASGNIDPQAMDVYQANAVPEPSSLALLGMGAFSLFGYGWRRKKLRKTS